MVNCKQCGCKIVSYRASRTPVYCSVRCRSESQRSKWEFACRFCGKTFLVHPSAAKERPELSDFCRIACRIEFSEREIKRRRLENLPLIQVNRDSIQCLICGRSYRVIGTHMGTHGLNTRHLNHHERNLALGLGCGARAVPDSVLDRMRIRGMSINYFGDKRHHGSTNTDHAYMASLRASFPITDVQVATLSQNAKIQHEKACARRIRLERVGFKICAECGQRKDLSEFGRSNRGARGYHCTCKKCFTMRRKIAHGVRTLDMTNQKAT